MPVHRSITVRATDSSHLELLRPLERLPSGEFEILIPVEQTEAPSAPDRAAGFNAWAVRPRPAVGLADTGRDTIYGD